MVITAHPDDEVLIAGGTLAACAAAGVPTEVVCLTRGEEGPISDPVLSTRENLPEVRATELRAACSELGVGRVSCYRRQDGNLPWSNRGGIIRQLVRILESRRPDAVISFGEDGLYYHPDHIATYEFTRQAMAAVTAPPTLYRALWPAGLMLELVRELSERGLPGDLWELGPEDFGVEDVERTGEIVLDVRRFAARKLRALRCHRTQLRSDHAFTVLPAELVETFLGTEWFVAVGHGGNQNWLPDAVAAGSGMLRA
jgi:N-acetyl-1-D-myo-inositol-2-amino-2-deoxy-alpha-D-glucopyranoside deacetylase